MYAALLPWNYFAASVGSSANSLVGSAHLVSKVYFPRLIIPLSSIGAPFVDLLVSMSVLVALMVWYSVAPSMQLLAVPLLLLGITLAAIGVGTLLSALTVTYRDFTHITPFLIQVWMYATPVIFPASLVPERWRWLLYLNPMSGFVQAFRDCFLGHPLNGAAIAASLATSLVAFAIGVAYFEKAERRFADVI